MLRLLGLFLFLLIVLALVLDIVNDLHDYSIARRKNNLSFSAWRKANVYNDIFLPEK
ncbi:hypothetical protein GNF18_02040 [Ligilactobacillus pobuzihii]|uniref:hypothetical protein n=1 Tax=Ligilactobacillus pobuzihii TaxID=449659 RepID=UPI0019D037DA|nr:hypothetical protein [Ligilactobacillus pobuzihii]MBN7273954.1 hypothetical protein [Ligilactobacillus pobuzihii]